MKWALDERLEHSGFGDRNGARHRSVAAVAGTAAQSTAVVGEKGSKVTAAVASKIGEGVSRLSRGDIGDGGRSQGGR